jgi:hypothetical protein
VINPLTLETVKNVEVGGMVSRIIFSKKNNDLYHNVLKGSFLNSYVCVRDSKTLEVKDKIFVSFGLREFAIDEERGLLFAANVFTGNVEVIDLSHKKMIKLIKTSDYMLRRLALDKINRYVYITSLNGVYRYHY